MQQTRRHILDILKLRGEATVDEIVEDLQANHGKDITAVTVRHHLTRLHEDDLIAAPQLRHRNTPGRPQHVYSLSEKATAQFPNNFQRLAEGLLQGLQTHLPPDGVNVILEDVAVNMAEEAQIADLPFEERLDMAVAYLNDRGYEAHYESSEDNYLLYTSNCPYHHLASSNTALCDMDMRLIASLVGVVPRRMAHVIQGDNACVYQIPNQNQ